MIHVPPANPACCRVLKDLLDQKEKQDKTIRKLKKQLKLLVKRVEEFEGELPLTDPECFSIWMKSPFNLWFVRLANAQLKNNPTATSPVRAVNIGRKEKDYCGMLEYKEGEEGRVLKALVTGMLNT